MGSDSDFPVMQETAKMLDYFKVTWEIEVISAHRSPDKAAKYAVSAESRGIEVIIAGAGSAAALPGVIAAYTVLPVIGVPMAGSALHGVDALYAINQMPTGVPVATMAIGKAGATNAAILAVQILARKNPELRGLIVDFKKELAEGIERKSEHVKNEIRKAGK